MTASAAAFSVIVPVHDEAALLPETVPLLLAGLGPCELVYVCNGCTDGSAAVVRALAGPRARVIELARAGKPAAIRAGEAATAAFPRVYLDADVWISGAALTALAAELGEGGAELVAPRLVADIRGAGRAAALVTRAWMASRHMRTEGFHSLLGVSAAGRARWGRFPDLINDDDFVTGRIPPERRRISTVRATIRPPLTFWSWVRVRERWIRGQREMARQGLAVPRTGGRLASHLAALRRGEVAATGCFLAARTLAWLLAATRDGGWYRDRTSRTRRA